MELIKQIFRVNKTKQNITNISLLRPQKCYQVTAEKFNVYKRSKSVLNVDSLPTSFKPDMYPIRKIKLKKNIIKDHHKSNDLIKPEILFYTKHNVIKLLILENSWRI